MTSSPSSEHRRHGDHVPSLRRRSGALIARPPRDARRRSPGARARRRAAACGRSPRPRGSPAGPRSRRGPRVARGARAAARRPGRAVVEVGAASEPAAAPAASPIPASRFGGSWRSQGRSGPKRGLRRVAEPRNRPRTGNGVSAEDLIAAGRSRRIANEVRAAAPRARAGAGRPRRRCGSPTPLPVMPYRVVSKFRPPTSSGYESGGSTVECDQGMITSLKQDEKARCWAKRSVLARARRTSAGTVGRSRATSAAQLGPRHQGAELAQHRQPRPQRLGALPHAGQGLAGERAQVGKRLVQLAEGRLALGEEAGQQLDRPAQRLVLGGERAGHAAQVRDQVAAAPARCGRARAGPGRGRG